MLLISPQLFLPQTAKTISNTNKTNPWKLVIERNNRSNMKRVGVSSMHANSGKNPRGCKPFSQLYLPPVLSERQCSSEIFISPSENERLHGDKGMRCATLSCRQGIFDCFAE